MAADVTTLKVQARRQSLIISLVLLGLFLLGWHLLTLRPAFDSTGLTQR